MKRFIFLIALLLTSLHLSASSANLNSIEQFHKATRRSNFLFKFIAENSLLRKFALNKLISMRCESFLNYEQAYGCKLTTKRQLEILDFDIVIVDEDEKKLMKSVLWTPPSFVFVAFRKNLFTLLKDPKTTDYLNFLEQELNKYVSQNGPEVNIWDLTLIYYPNKKEAAQVIATLFQDISAFKLHLAYLEVKKYKPMAIFDANKLLLSRVIDGINQILDMNEDHFKRLFYPSELYYDLNRNIYHFYVPFYLSLALKDEAPYSNYSRIAPLMLTLTYEFITLKKDSTYFFKNPVKLEAEQFRGTVLDIYASYRGIAFAQDYKSPLDVNSVNDLFMNSTYQAVISLLKPR